MKLGPRWLHASDRLSTNETGRATGQNRVIRSTVLDRREEKKDRIMKKFTFASVAAAALTAGFLGLAAPRASRPR